MKGLPVLIVPIVMLAVVMLVPKDYKVRFYSALIGLPVVGMVCLAAVLYFPHFISDILLAGKLGHMTYDPMRILQLSQWFFVYLGVNCAVVPLCLVGLVALALIGFYTTKQNMREVLLLFAMWIIAAVYVVLISEFYYYHYYLLILPVILTTCYFLKVYSRRKLAFRFSIVAVFILFVLMVAGWSYGLHSVESEYWSDRDLNATLTLTKYPDLLKQPATLYLDSGVAAYYFPTRSACRYVGALPIQRHTPSWNMTDVPAYKENLDCALSYTGKYVIVEPLWFNMNLSTHDSIRYKLDSEYTFVPGNYWDIYQRKD